MARLKKDQRDQVLGKTRQLLLDAAAEEIAREGFLGANINRISKSAGFAKGTIYNYFPSKKALLLSLVDSIAETHLDFIATQVLQEQDPARRLERFYQAGFAFVTQYLAQAQVMIHIVYGADDELKAHTYQAYQPMFQLVSRDIISAGIAQGIFRQVDPFSTATLLMTIYLATASQIDASGRFWQDPAQIAGFALNGLRRQE